MKTKKPQLERIALAAPCAALAAFTAATIAPLPASAGVKYWDSQDYRAYDASSYVQDNLVLHYDGIDNSGTGSHDSAAATWKNLGTGGADYDATIGGPAAASGYSGASGWTEDGKGFYFGGDAYFKGCKTLAIPGAYEFETVLDAAFADQTSIGQVFFRSFADPRPGDSDTAWNRCSFGLRRNGAAFSQKVGSTTHSGGTFVFNTHYFTDGRPMLTDASFTYVTALANASYTALFTGLEEPSAEPARFEAKSTVSTTGAAWYFIGGHGANNDDSQTAEALHGTIRDFRYYTSPLSAEQRAWNRVVDEWRYFGRKAALPETNAVVTANFPIVPGDQPNGVYAVDSEGFTFSAPAETTVRGRAYRLVSYAVASWDDETGGWGDASETPVSGAASVEVKATDKVRIVWRWEAGDGLVRYDAGDYVQDGLVLHYDGIRNAGADAAHDSAATAWKNLGTGGAAYDMTRGGAAAKSAWAGDGFAFGGDAYFKSASKQALPEHYEIEAAVDAKASDHSGIGYIYTRVFANSWASGDTAWNGSSLCVRPAWSQSVGGATYTGSLVFNTHFYSNGRPMVPTSETTAYDCVTALGDSKAAALFTGLEVPTAMPGRASAQAGTWAARAAAYVYLGGHEDAAGTGVGEALKGTVKDFRYYDRILSADERAWNRVVDEARYFTEPNVVVASTVAGVAGSEADGEYVVSGTYRFAVPETATAPNGVVYAPAGYALQKWDADAGAWGAAQEFPGAAYAYDAETDGKVRLLWRWKAVKGLRTAADYDVGDYVAGGLVLNYDGIRNAGADKGHDDAATTWVNLGTDGALRNATLTKTTDVEWAADGYVFDGARKFLVGNSTGVGTASHTVQIRTDAVQNEQQGYAGVEETTNPMIYFFSGTASSFAAAASGSSFYWRVQGNGADLNLRFTFDKGSPIGYATAITDAAAKKAYVFQGTAKPASGTGVKSYDAIMTPAFDNLAIGGWGGATTSYPKGGINFFRYYDRVLSDAELARNREVDVARFEGVLAATNVFVVAGGGEQSEEGAYRVEGAWTFTAKTVNGPRGTVEPVGRYSVETLVDGVWTDRTWHDGDSYEYVEETSPATVRLTWKFRPLGMTVVIR